MQCRLFPLWASVVRAQKYVDKPNSIILLTLHSSLFKDAINLTAMDKRSFAPPIETNWERVVNMANTCETFRINPTTTSRLIKCGFTSITLLSMAEGNFEERGLTGDRLKNCLSVLNDRRVHILEPSYSLQRLVNARRKRWSEMKKYQFLDLASVNGKKLWELRPPDREYRVSKKFTG